MKKTLIMRALAPILALAVCGAFTSAAAADLSKRDREAAWYAQVGLDWAPEIKPRKLEAFLGGPVTLRGSIDEDDAIGASIVVGRELAMDKGNPYLRVEAEARGSLVSREALSLGALKLTPNDNVQIGALLGNVGLRLLQYGDTSFWVFGGAGLGLTKHPSLTAQTRCKCLSENVSYGLALQAKAQIEHALTDTTSVFLQGAYLWMPRSKMSDYRPAFTRYERIILPSASIGLRYAFRS